MEGDMYLSDSSDPFFEKTLEAVNSLDEEVTPLEEEDAANWRALANEEDAANWRGLANEEDAVKLRVH